MAREVSDVTGAGDTVVATAALALAAGATLAEAAMLANHAAGVVVAKFGPATVSPGGIELIGDRDQPRAASVSEVPSAREHHREVVIVGGGDDFRVAD